MTADLVAFLKARLDEDAAIALRASEPAAWMELNRQPRPTWYVQYWADPDRAVIVADPQSSSYSIVATLEGDDEADAEARTAHIARHNPARALREVAAKRSAIEEYESVVESMDDYDPDGMGRAMVSSLRGVLEAAASVYADHTDCQEGWKP